MSTCATASRDAAEPVAGTSATARTWLLVEQTGPWGTEALTESHLDPRIGRALETAADGTGVRVALVRRPGRHADCHGSVARRAFLAHTAPDRPWIRTGSVTEPEALLRLDFARLGAGEHDGLWDPYDGEPLVFVCTNGKRDRCCAILGRPLASELADSGAEAWEITHIGGHRFSPTLFVLPYGYAYGRASAPLVKDAVASAREGRILLDHCRGRSTWERPGQAAELAVRELIREDRADAIDVVHSEAVPPPDDVSGGNDDTDEGAAGPGHEGAVATAPMTPTTWATTPPPMTPKPLAPSVPLGAPAAPAAPAAPGALGSPATPAAPAPPAADRRADTPALTWAVTIAHRDGRTWRVMVEQRADGAPAPVSCGSPLGRPARMAVLAVLPLSCPGRASVPSAPSPDHPTRATAPPELPISPPSRTTTPFELPADRPTRAPHPTRATAPSELRLG
ncbi:sucrase ferredoxin [Streptomyces sp. CB02923]|uniref:sucrase ferredoxin n=1 Tax=Streptomyces sp. CB02923 TaxID=1718985 RepID=UPI0009A11145|nr:sucrase ferredoxin [Streptomyces sp. CB02923]